MSLSKAPMLGAEFIERKPILEEPYLDLSGVRNALKNPESDEWKPKFLEEERLSDQSIREAFTAEVFTAYVRILDVLSKELYAKPLSDALEALSNSKVKTGAQEIETNPSECEVPDVEVADYGDDRPLMNYIWINNTKAATKPGEPMCAIGLQNIELAVANANQYPQADFKIWVDKKLLDDSTNFWLSSFVYINAKNSNIEICDLQTIPDYSKDPLFSPAHVNDPSKRTGAGNVYVRADYARIVVLNHSLAANSSRSRIFYSDIDCPDIRLFRAVATVDKYGVVINDMEPFGVSNGYIGLSNKNESIKNRFAILKNEARASALAHGLGYEPFGLFLQEIGLPHRRYMSQIGIRDLLPYCRYKIAPKPVLEELHIN